MAEARAVVEVEDLELSPRRRELRLCPQGFKRVSLAACNDGAGFGSHTAYDTLRQRVHALAAAHVERAKLSQVAHHLRQPVEVATPLEVQDAQVGECTEAVGQAFERRAAREQEALETYQRELAMELATFDSGDGSDDGGRPRGSEEEEEEEGGQKVSTTAEQWQEVVQMARKRGLGQCSICLCDNKGLRGLSLLSCSHVFHSTCLLSFERFSRTRKVGQSLSSLYYKRFKSFQRLTVSYIFSFIYSCLSCDSLYSNAQAAPCVARPSAPPASPPTLSCWVEARARKGLPSPARAPVVSLLYACIHCSFCNSAVPVVRSLSLSLLLLIGGHRP